MIAPLFPDRFVVTPRESFGLVVRKPRENPLSEKTVSPIVVRNARPEQFPGRSPLSLDILSIFDKVEETREVVRPPLLQRRSDFANSLCLDVPFITSLDIAAKHTRI